MIRCRKRPAAVAALAVWLGLAPAHVAPSYSAESSPPVFKILVETPGVYRVDFEDLAAAGLGDAGFASDGLALTDPQGAVPIWIEDGGDGAFDPGDWIEFVGEHLRGEGSYLSEHSRYNVYFLRFDVEGAPRMTAVRPRPAPSEPAAGSFHALERQRHFEEDRLLLRLPPPAEGQVDELWYWAKLAHNQAEPWSRTLELGDLARDSGGGVGLRIELRGWSRPEAKSDPAVPDHRVDVSLNGSPAGVAEWNGQAPFLLELPPIPADRWVAGDNLIELRVPARTLGEEAAPLIDVVMLNWIEVTYPHDGWVGERQARFDLVAPSAPRPVRLRGESPGGLRVYGEAGSRIAAAGGAGPLVFDAAGERSFHAAGAEGLLAPEAIELDRPSTLADPGNRADYLMIAHRRLLEGIHPLAEFHRSRGLEVSVVDVQDVYDEFNHGVVHPRAIRAFLEHAYHRWARPAPRFVLLVGDASWDGKNIRTADENYADWTWRSGETDRFSKNQSTPYAEGAELNRRHLVPTWNLPTYEGHSASDNWFVAVDGDGPLPDLAIGRFPVVEPEEVAQIVDKTISYATSPEVGPWRRNLLLITNEARNLQVLSDLLAAQASVGGLRPQRIYPDSAETSNERHTRKLLDALDDGQLLVHFIGHGGRYIWRTGPPDLKKNHDLFTLDDLDRLQPTGRLPVVLSMTCYTAPFDHPSADSIGEKLLRIPDRGAVAVLAASWRNSPQVSWGEVLVEELVRPGTTIGEAILRAKHRSAELPLGRMLIETYNLLGDPAVRVALPAGEVALSASVEREGRLRVAGRVELPGFGGRLLLDLADERGEQVHSTAFDLESPDFAAELEIAPERVAAVRTVRAYAWNAERKLDAAGAATLEHAPAVEPGAGPFGGR